MKKVVLGCGAALALVAVIAGIVVYFVFRVTSPMVDAADSFLAKLSGGDIPGAYAETAKEFQAATSEQAFRAFLASSSIGTAVSGSWNNRSIENNRGEIEGTLTTSDGGKIPVTISFVNEDDAWKILAIEKADAGVVKPPGDDEAVPTSAKAAALAKETIVALGEAINDEDFSGFHEQISDLWKSQASPEELRKAFEPFAEKGIDLTVVSRLDAVVEEPLKTDEDGILVIRGHFPTTPFRVVFELKYIAEGGAWKAVGVNVNTVEQ